MRATPLYSAWSRIDFNTQEDHAAKGKPAATGDSSAQRLKDAVSSIFSVSGARCSSCLGLAPCRTPPPHELEQRFSMLLCCVSCPEAREVPVQP